ncbi:MAG TPA: hypothetical protein G4O03_06855 [Dehalococcoidia bacterium]|nr:hypothetical protein [Dehalococcoidia bacterium]
MERQIRYSIITLLACVPGIFVGLAVRNLDIIAASRIPSGLVIAVVFGICAAFLSGIILSGFYQLFRYIFGKLVA